MRNPAIDPGDPLPRISQHAQDALVKTLASALGETPACTPGSGRLSGEWIVGMISFVGGVPFSLMLALPRESACPIGEKFAGFALEAEGSEIADVIGELVRVVAEGTVTRLRRAGVEAEASIPTVARGSSLWIPALHGQPEHVTVYTTGLGKLWMRVGIRG